MSAFISWDTACQFPRVHPAYEVEQSKTYEAVMLRRHRELIEQGVSPAEARRQAKDQAGRALLDRAEPSYQEWRSSTEEAIHYWFADRGIYASKCRTSESFRLSPLCDDWKQQYETAVEELQELGPLSKDDPVLTVTGGWMWRTLCVLGRISREQALTESRPQPESPRQPG